MNSPLPKLKSSSKTRNTSVRKAIAAAGLLSGAALSSIVAAAPAQAACGSGPLSSLANTSIACGDKVYTFNSSPFTAFLPSDTYAIAVGGSGIHSLSVLSSSQWAAGNYTLNYSVVVAPPSTEVIRAYNAAITTPDGSAVATYTVASGPTTPASISTPLASVAIGPSMTAALSNLTPTVTQADFTTTLNVTSGFITQVTSSIRQTTPQDRVPGPLPLLGAGAAFGFSRRIRSRIKASA